MKTKQLLLLLLLSVLTFSLNAQVIYVNKLAAGTNNGTSWTNAFINLQDAIDAANVNNQIWVAAGTYLPTKDHTGNTAPTDNRNKNFHLGSDIKIYGGFLGTETQLTQRNVSTNATILSGDFNADDVVTGSGGTLSITNNIENAYHVFITANLTNAAIIDGFTISGGNADALSTITYQSQTFQMYSGGGFANISSSPTIENCTFKGNSSVFTGGGLSNNFSSSPIVTNCNFTTNASRFGGGQYNRNFSSGTFTNCVFTSNNATGDGGGQYNTLDSEPALKNCTFTANSAANFGGGQYNNNFSSPTLTNCTFTLNSAMNGGGGQYNGNSSSPTLTNCTLTANSALTSGSGQFNNSTSSPILTNCIVWGNTPSSNVNVFSNLSSFPTFSHSIIEGSGGSGTWNSSFGTDNGNNLDSNPLFVDAANGNLRLINTSPAIDAGTAVAHTSDIEGNPHVGTVDMGAYEFQSTVSPTTIYVNHAATGANNGTSWTDAYINLQDAIDMASVNDEIWVAAGTYLPTKDHTGNTTPTDNRDKNFHVGINVKIYGGFVGTETLLSQRNAKANLTVLSGDFDKDDVVTGGGFTLSITNITENAYHVFITANLTNAAIIDGFTISGGNADVGNNILYQTQSFIGFVGGGLYNSSSSPTISNCTFKANAAAGTGGGQSNAFSSPIIMNCTFTSNLATGGGGQFNESSSPTLKNCIFSSNSSLGGGGQFNNSLSSPSLTNCTFTSNSADDSGGGQLNIDSSPTLTNSILWGNTAASGANILSDNGTATFSHCLVEGSGSSGNWDGGFGTDNGNNLDVNPNFVDAANGDLRLTGCSPAIDAGTTVAHTSDIEGNPHVGTVDIGAYEFQGSAYGAAIYVNKNATGANNGSSWANAYTDLQDAIDNQCGGLDIWVAAGTYLPTKDHTGNASPTDNRDKNFHLSTDMKIYGGFAGTETLLSQRNTATNNTILSGDFNADDLVTGGGSTLSITNNTENAYHVFITANLTTAAVIDGFTFSGGNAENSGSITYQSQLFRNNRGGGFYNISSSPTLANCTFTANSATLGGGQNNRDSSSPTMTNCIFTANSATLGGGQYNRSSSSPTMTNCTFTANFATDGGGQYNTSSSPILTNCTFTANSAVDNGFGSDGGGQLNEVSSSPILTNCTFTANSATFGGGGQFNRNSAFPTLINCTFTANTATIGGGQFNADANPILTNCTFTANSVTNSGGGQNNQNGNPILTNCIIWGNTAPSDANVSNVSSTPTFSYSLIEGSGGSISWNSSFGTDNGNNLDVNPLFVNAANGDLSLSGCSPAVNAGTADTTGLNLGLVDLDGNPRVFDDRIDIGAYERQTEPFKVTANTVSTVICPGSTLNLSALAENGDEAATYAWTGPNGFTDNIQNPVVSNADSGTYVITAIAGLCTAKDSIKISYPEEITITTSPSAFNDIFGCENALTVIGLNIENAASFTYQWQLSTGGAFANLAETLPYSQVTNDTLEINPTSLSMDGYQYRALISNGCETVISDTFNLRVGATPMVTLQPIDQIVCPNNEAILEVDVNGTGVSFQWQIDNGSGFENVNGPEYFGANGKKLIISNFDYAKSGKAFRCLVFTSCFQIPSEPATITINTDVTILAQPTSQSVCEFGTAIFTAQAIKLSAGTLTYQWQRKAGTGNWIDVNTGGRYIVNGNQLQITNAPASWNGAEFRCLMNDYCQTIPKILNVIPVAHVTQNPVDQEICVGNNANFSVKAAGEGLMYRWQVNSGSDFTNLTDGGIYQGVTSANLSLSFPTAAVNNYQYRCVVSGTSTCDLAADTSSVASISIGVSAEAQTVFYNSSVTTDEGITQAVGYILGINKILQPNGKAEYRAGNAIILNPGFEVEAGAVFSAKIMNPCLSVSTSSAGGGSVPKELVK